MNQKTKWIILALAGLTNAIAIAMPSMGLPVLFDEISQELNLSLVQVGVVWGISSLPGILTSLFVGAVIDRFGPRRMIIIGAFLVGVTGALRGFSTDFYGLLVTVVLAGLLAPVITMSGMKNCSMWFPRRQLGLANGVLSMGMALGFLMGSLLSASVLSPWLGGWRYVLFFFGAIAALLSIPWFFTPEPPALKVSTGVPVNSGMGQAIRQIVRLKDTWLLGFGLFGIGGCIQAALGYLPLYLRGQGWTDFSSDAALSSFHLVSMVFAMPIALLSDRLGSRKNLVLLMSAFITTGIALLSFTRGSGVWVSVMLAGFVRDAFMAIFLTMVMETEGVGPQFSGTAIGFVMIFSMAGSMIAPPIGNTLAEITPGLPFLLWAGLAAAGLFSISLTRRNKPLTEPIRL